ncbi:MAG: TonB-dependent receptor plug domain-containing protein [Pseudoalteromonas sp.]
MKIKEILLPVAALVSTTVLANTDETNTENQMTVIEVTGELLSRSLLQSGNSVVVFDAKTLENRPELRTVRDVLSEIPNITMVTGTGKAPTVRGIDGTGAAENANAFFAGSRARLNWQIDGRSATYNEIVFGDLGIWDLNQIEVLRGPQSTLAGRNAIAGTIRVETQDPTFEQQFTIRAEGGNLDQKRLSATYNQPLTEQFSVRIAADQFERRSPVDYEPYPDVDNPAEMEGRAIRGKLLYEGNDQYDTRIVVTLTDNKYTGPNGEIIDYPFDERRSNFPQQPVHVTHTKSVGVEYNAAINEQLALEVTASATDFNFERKSTPDGSKANVDTKEYVIEPRLRYQGDNGAQWVIGSRYYSAKQDDWIQFIVKQSFTDDSNNFAIY